MTSLTRVAFQDRLMRCIEDAIELIKDETAAPLPHFYRFELHGFGRDGMESWLDDVLGHLYCDGAFPRAVDVAILGAIGGATLVWLRPSGHPFVSTVEEALPAPPDTSPFKPIAFVLDRPHPLSLHNLQEISPAWARETGRQGATLAQVLEEISDRADTSLTTMLRRFWIIFERTEDRYDRDTALPRPGGSARFGIANTFSCGVTAHDINDALSLVQSLIFNGESNPPVLAIIHDVDLTPYARDIQTNAKRMRERGIWYPLSD